MTPDAEILRFAARSGGRPPADYGRFTGELSLDELAMCFFFDDHDRRLIARRRTGATRLGFALQLGTVRYLGRFLEDPAQVPARVVDVDGAGDRRAGQHRPWRVRARGVAVGSPGGDPRRVRLSAVRGAWGRGGADRVAARPRVGHAESHPVLFARAVEHLIAAKILLPGASTVWRLVGGAREHANERGWALLAAGLTEEQRARLEALLTLVGGRRESELERLRRAPVEPTVAGLIAALQRVGELRTLADGLGGLDVLPVARMRALSVDAATRRAGDLAKMSDARRLATLVAFTTIAAWRAQDDALEHFDRLHGELQLRVRKQGERERLRDNQELDRAGLTLAGACRYLLRGPGQRADRGRRVRACRPDRRGRRGRRGRAAGTLAGRPRPRVDPHPLPQRASLPAAAAGDDRVSGHRRRRANPRRARRVGRPRTATVLDR